MFADCSGGRRSWAKHLKKNMHTNSPVTDKVVVVISTASLCFSFKLLMSMTTGVLFLFGGGDGISYDVRIFVGCVEKTVWM